MSNEHDKKAQAESWGAYWTGADAASEAVTGGAKGAVLDEFWRRFLTPKLSSGAGRLLDIACGVGPVSSHAAKIIAEAHAEWSLHCTDYSPMAVSGALNAVKEAAPDQPVYGFVSDGAQLPVAPKSCGLVVSQFGIEYAGADAFNEAAAALAPGGAFGAVVHLKGGAIEAECAVNLEIVEKANEIGLLPVAREAFDAAYATKAGEVDAVAYQMADRKLAQAMDGARELITNAPAAAARDFLLKAFNDLCHMYPRKSSFDPAQVTVWLDRAEFELAAYIGRMTSMIGAAQSDADMQDISERLKAAGLTILSLEKLQMGKPLQDAAWTLIAERPQ